METIAEHPDELPVSTRDREEPRLSPLVDMTNPWLRALLESGTYLRVHKESLDAVRAKLADFAAASEARENAEAAAGGREARPLAFVFDIDELLLSNVACQGACRAGKGAYYYPADHFTDGAGAPWPRDSPFAPALPGARELLAEAARLGEVALVTGRGERLRGETVDNFVAVGLAGDGAPLDAEALREGALVMCPDARLPAPGQSIEPFKRAARVRITQTHRIVAILGDQPSDMGAEGDYSILFPNPFYFTP